MSLFFSSTILAEVLFYTIRYILFTSIILNYEEGVKKPSRAFSPVKTLYIPRGYTKSIGK